MEQFTDERTEQRGREADTKAGDDLRQRHRQQQRARARAARGEARRGLDSTELVLFSAPMVKSATWKKSMQGAERDLGGYAEPEHQQDDGNSMILGMNKATTASARPPALPGDRRRARIRAPARPSARSGRHKRRQPPSRRRAARMCTREILSRPSQGGARRRQRLRSGPLKQQDPGQPHPAGQQDVVERSDARRHSRYQRRCSACSSEPSTALTTIAKPRISTSRAYIVWLSKLL